MSNLRFVVSSVVGSALVQVNDYALQQMALAIVECVARANDKPKACGRLRFVMFCVIGCHLQLGAGELVFPRHHNQSARVFSAPGRGRADRSAADTLTMPLSAVHSSGTREFFAWLAHEAHAPSS